MAASDSWLVAYSCPTCGARGEASFSQNVPALSGQRDRPEVGRSSEGFRVVERTDQSGLPLECVACGVFAERLY